MLNEVDIGCHIVCYRHKIPIINILIKQAIFAIQIIVRINLYDSEICKFN